MGTNANGKKKREQERGRVTEPVNGSLITTTISITATKAVTITTTITITVATTIALTVAITITMTQVSSEAAERQKLSTVGDHNKPPKLARDSGNCSSTFKLFQMKHFKYCNVEITIVVIFYPESCIKCSKKQLESGYWVSNSHPWAICVTTYSDEKKTNFRENITKLEPILLF